LDIRDSHLSIIPEEASSVPPALSIDPSPLPAISACLPEQVVELTKQWVEQRAELIAFGNGKSKDLHRKLQDLENTFIAELKTYYAKVVELRQALPAIHSLAQTIHSRLREDLAVFQEQKRDILLNFLEAETVRAASLVGRNSAIIDSTQSVISADKELGVASMHTREMTVDKLVKSAFPDYVDSRYTELSEQKIRAKIERQVELLSTVATKRGESEYLRADILAQELHALLPRTGQNSERLFQILWELSPAQREHTFKVYQERYQQDFPESISASYNNVGIRARATHFLKIPELKVALSERYGLDVGLLSVAKIIIPNPLKVKEYFNDLNDFVFHLNEKVKAPDTSRIEALVKNDRIEAAAHSLHMCLRARKDPVEIVDLILKDLSADQRKQAVACLRETYGVYYQGKALPEILLDTYPKNKQVLHRELLLAALSGHDAKSDAIGLELAVSKDKKRYFPPQKLLDFQGLTPEQQREIHSEYSQYFGTPLNGERLARTLSGARLTFATEALAGNSDRAAAARIYASLKNQSDEWAGTPLYERDLEQRRKVATAFREMYGSELWDQIAKKKGTERANIMRKFVENGDVDELDLIRHCLPAIGKDVAGLLGCISRLKPEELLELEGVYRARFRDLRPTPGRLANAVASFVSTLGSEQRETGIVARLRESKRVALEELQVPASIHRTIKSKFCGHDLFDIKELLLEPTDEPFELHKRFVERFIHELGHRKEKDFCERSFEERLAIPASELERRERLKARFGNSRVGRLVEKWVHDTNPVTDSMYRDAKLLNDFFRKRILNQTPTSKELQQYRLLLQLAGNSLKGYREHRLSRAATFSNLSAAGLGGSAAGSFALLGVPYLVAAPLATGGFFASRYFVRARLIGEGYGKRQIATDASMAAIEGSTFALSKFAQGSRLLVQFGLRSNLSRITISSLGKFALKKALNQLNNNTLSRVLLEEQESGHARKAIEADAIKVINDTESTVRLRALKASMVEHQRERKLSLNATFRRLAKQVDYYNL